MGCLHRHRDLFESFRQGRELCPRVWHGIVSSLLSVLPSRRQTADLGAGDAGCMQSIFPSFLLPPPPLLFLVQDRVCFFEHSLRLSSSLPLLQVPHTRTVRRCLPPLSPFVCARCTPPSPPSASSFPSVELARPDSSIRAPSSEMWETTGLSSLTISRRSVRVSYGTVVAHDGLFSVSDSPDSSYRGDTPLCCNNQWQRP